VKPFLGIITALCMSLPSYGQHSQELKRLAREAGIVFSGTVISIEAECYAIPGDVGVIRVGFRVIDGLRGATAGQILTISEWAGLWTSGDRYRIGETVVLFLYPPSDELGLTTTVSGPSGHIPLSEVTLPLSSLATDSGNNPVSEPDRTPLHRPFRPPFRAETSY